MASLTSVSGVERFTTAERRSLWLSIHRRDEFERMDGLIDKLKFLQPQERNVSAGFCTDKNIFFLSSSSFIVSFFV